MANERKVAGEGQEERFGRMFRASPSAATLVRLSDNRFLELNEAFEELTGWTRDEMLGRTPEEIGLFADPAEAQALRARFRADGRLRGFPGVLKRKDGEARSVLFSSEGLEIDGEAVRLSILLDVTERDRAQAALASSEERLRQLAGAVQEAFWLSDVDKQRFLYVSPGYETIWGRPVARLDSAPLDWLAAVHPDDRARVHDAAVSKQVDGTYDEEYRIVRPSGEVRWIHDRAFPVRDPDGVVRRVAGVAQDVTTRRELEEQLRHAQKLESVGQLAGGVAHDFNNLLTVIASCNEILSESLGCDEELCREVVEESREAVTRAVALTRQLLAFSRKQVVELRPFDLGLAVGDTEKMLRRLLGEDIRLEIRLTHGLPAVNGDAGYMVQVLMNLAVNARDAMPCGGTLRLETRLEELDAAHCRAFPGAQPGPHIVLVVTDTGTGMSPEVKDRAFEPFFTTKPSGRGTGMGLSVTHGIVTQAGGHIALDSELGVGTTFRIYLPAAQTVPARVGRAITGAQVTGNETVLLVEDEDSVRRVASRSLRRAGYTVFEANDGAEALEILGQRGADIQLVVTDVVMPEVGGREVAEASGHFPGLRVLFTSGHTDDALLHHGVRLNEVAFLPKPYTPQGLASRVREVLDAPAAPDHQSE